MNFYKKNKNNKKNNNNKKNKKNKKEKRAKGGTLRVGSNNDVLHKSLGGKT